MLRRQVKLGKSPVVQPHDSDDVEEREEGSEVTVTKSQLITSQQQDESMEKMYEEAKQEGSAFVVRGGVLYRRPFTSNLPEQQREVTIDHSEEEQEPLLIVIPKDLRREVLERGHDFAGHMGIKKTKKMVQAHFYWPQMGQDIVQYCKSCEV